MFCAGDRTLVRRSYFSQSVEARERVRYQKYITEFPNNRVKLTGFKKKLLQKIDMDSCLIPDTPRFG